MSMKHAPRGVKTYGKQMPKSEARPLGTKKPTGKKNPKIVKKEVDTPPAVEVESLQQSEPQAIPQAASVETAAKEQQTMTLIYKSASKNGRQAIYSGAGAFNVRFNVKSFPGGTAPSSIEVADGTFVVKEPKQPRVKLTKEERAALPKPTLAERIAKREAQLAKDKAKLAADANAM